MILVLKAERTTSTAGAFRACVFDDACVQTTLTVQRWEGSPQPLLCPGRPPPPSVVGAPTTPRPSATNCPRSLMSFSAVLRYFLETPRRMAHNLSRSPEPKQPQWVRRPRLLPTRGLIQLRSCLHPPSHHGRGGRHTKSRRRRSRDKLKLSSEGKVQHGRQGPWIPDRLHRLLTLASAAVPFYPVEHRCWLWSRC